MNEIERVARAICCPNGLCFCESFAGKCCAIEEHGEHATAAIAAMRGEPVGFRYTKPFHEDVFSWFREPALADWTETALYAGPTPPDNGD